MLCDVVKSIRCTWRDEPSLGKTWTDNDWRLQNERSIRWQLNSHIGSTCRLLSKGHRIYDVICYCTLHKFHFSPLTCGMLLTECYLVILALYHFNIMNKVKIVAQIDISFSQTGSLREQALYSHTYIIQQSQSSQRKDISTAPSLLWI